VTKARADHGVGAVDRLQAALGQQVFEVPPETADVVSRLADGSLLATVLAEVDLPSSLADALEDTSWDAEVQASTDAALVLTGKDVGTPVLHFQPPHGVAFFGPVISRLPSEQDAVALWDHVVGLAGFPGFAELKRSLRERPQLPAFGVRSGEAGLQEDWHGGSRRQHR
jgi:hypothetical protein